MERPKPEINQKDRFAVPKREVPFAERTVRFTTYLERDVHAEVQRLHRDGSIASITALVNAALRLYISEYYNDKA